MWHALAATRGLRHASVRSNHLRERSLGTETICPHEEIGLTVLLGKSLPCHASIALDMRIVMRRLCMRTTPRAHARAHEHALSLQIDNVPQVLFVPKWESLVGFLRL
jgi:hypothetical protein